MTTPTTSLMVGSQAPDLELQSPDGGAVSLSSCWREGPLALVLLGRLESDLCVDHVLQLRDADQYMREAGGDFVAVSAAPPETITLFRERWSLPYTLLSDSTGQAYRRFDVSREQPGTFVIDTQGSLRYVHRNHGLLDNPSTWSLVDVVCSITGRVVEQPEPAAPPDDNNEALAAQTDTPSPGITLANFTCAKCRYTDCEIMDVSASSGMLSRMFNFQHRRFSAVTCKRCQYTEFYKTESGKLRNIFDLLVGS